MSRAAFRDVVLACPVSVPYARFSARGAQYFIGTALRGLLAESGLEKREVDGLCVSSFSLYPDSGIGLLRALGLQATWLDTIPLGGASGIVALRRAARAVESGDAGIVACIAGDTCAPGGFREATARFSQASQDAVYPVGAGGPNASFAMITDHYMRRFGAVAEDFGRLCVAQRANAGPNPRALLRKPITLEDYLASRPISAPVRLLDCVMPCAGAEGFLVMRRGEAEARGLPHCHLLAATERHNAYADDPVQERGGWAADRETLFAAAGTTPAGVDLFQSYDDYPVISFLQLEDLGFCAKGEAGAFVAAHDLSPTGDFPMNTGGGQHSTGQAGAAGGFLGLTETLRQLTGRAEERAVPGARIGLVSGFGMIAYDRGLSCGAAVLAAA
ncbi:thiolase family protein (plasmid) [Paroceanicella profunda]|uniref:Thiolase family protein n=1 Tax=Paroceanicella profunda TaxID=2579971 RepID=A0A5B8G4R6_9RHOB|nr:thiolase family protein [Paroceanicella profunda]QDL94449.1 thiolase family protein [Paroceanicella profunda]